jgi:hypothetical protein
MLCGTHRKLATVYRIAVRLPRSTRRCCAIAAWLRFAAGHRPELLASAIGSVAGFTYFLYRQHLDETKLFKELFKEFNARYDALNDDLNTILSGPPEGSLSPDEKKPVFSYFNLCAEEYFFYKAGYIDRRVWNPGIEGWGSSSSIHAFMHSGSKTARQIHIMAFFHPSKQPVA